LDELILPFSHSDLKIISGLFPEEWNFNFREFIKTHSGKNYFRGFTLTLDSRPIGFGNLIIFGNTGWIGNIVVDNDYRHKGFGTTITRFLVDTGRNMGVRSFNLIATKKGEKIYTRLGFKTELMYEFYRQSGIQKTLSRKGIIRRADQNDLDRVVTLDSGITGENRFELLKDFISETIMIFNEEQEFQGFYIETLGNGLIISIEETYGLELLKNLIIKSKTVAITDKNIAAGKFLVDNGFEKYNELPRMCLGDKYSWKPECIYSRAAGYLG
jgi:GNAT superfamily N-acetyltransferase